MVTVRLVQDDRGWLTLASYEQQQTHSAHHARYRVLLERVSERIRLATRSAILDSGTEITREELDGPANRVFVNTLDVGHNVPAVRIEVGLDGIPVDAE